MDLKKGVKEGYYDNQCSLDAVTRCECIDCLDNYQQVTRVNNEWGFHKSMKINASDKNYSTSLFFTDKDIT